MIERLRGKHYREERDTEAYIADRLRDAFSILKERKSEWRPQPQG